jgi:glycosyltransferase involved in cell wall biosynthesis
LETIPGLRVVCLGQHDLLGDHNRLRALCRGLWNFGAAAALRKLLAGQDRSGTIVHVHGWTKALTSSSIREAVSAGYHVVLTLHDFYTVCPNGILFNYPRRQMCQFHPLGMKCLSARCDARHHAHKCWRVLRQVVQHRLGQVPEALRDFITISDLSCQILAPHLPRRARLHRVGNPVEAVPCEPVAVERNRLFTFVGRFAPEKGPDLLAVAAARSGVQAMFVGDGAMRDRVVSLCPSATITGWLPHEQVRSCLALGRALVLPSRCYELQPLVVLEAAALGVPAIVSSTCAAREAVEHEVTGLWFRNGDTADLEHCIRRLLDVRFAQRLGRAAHERFWKIPPTLDGYARRLEEVYQTILGT